ncbi:MAG: Gfo/Idh/MocA family oxidoreductase, partial [Dehalococcoidales bacterium]|nr:Gfo/Idh/MocA family oxidoreductase [Dehalococcoidales bacterium]
GSRAEDNAFALFRTSTGQTASLHASWTQWKNLFSYEVFGQDGYLTVEGLGGSYGPERLIWGCRRPESGPPDEQVFDFPGPDISWAAEWQEFVTAIREGREPLTNANDGLQAIRMVYAVYESSRTGQVVRL